MSECITHRLCLKRPQCVSGFYYSTRECISNAGEQGSSIVPRKGLTVDWRPSEIRLGSKTLALERAFGFRIVCPVSRRVSGIFWMVGFSLGECVRTR